MVSSLNSQLNYAFLSLFLNCQVQVSLSGLKFSLGDSQLEKIFQVPNMKEAYKDTDLNTTGKG